MASIMPPTSSIPYANRGKEEMAPVEKQMGTWVGKKIYVEVSKKALFITSVANIIIAAVGIVFVTMNSIPAGTALIILGVGLYYGSLFGLQYKVRKVEEAMENYFKQTPSDKDLSNLPKLKWNISHTSEWEKAQQQNDKDTINYLEAADEDKYVNIKIPKELIETQKNRCFIGEYEDKEVMPFVVALTNKKDQKCLNVLVFDYELNERKFAFEIEGTVLPYLEEKSIFMDYFTSIDKTVLQIKEE